MKQMKWPPEFSTKVDIKNVDLDVIKPWIHRKVIEYLGDEDELLIDFVISALEQPNEKGLDPRQLQIQLTGFLEKNAGRFMKDLWCLLIDAQNSPNGIPPALIEEKKDEIRQQKQELEQDLNKLQSIKAFMTGNKENRPAPTNKEEEENQKIDEEKDRDQGGDRRKEKDVKGNISRLASKLRTEKAPSAEREEEVKGKQEEGKERGKKKKGQEGEIRGRKKESYYK